jgi:hypothetical protein
MGGEGTQSRRGDIVGSKRALLEQKFHLLGNKSSIYELQCESLLQGLESQGGVMTTLQAMCLGVMLAWTPSLVVLPLLLRAAPVDDLEGDPS